VELQGTPLYFCFLISLIVRLTVSPCLVCRFVLTECDFIITIIVIDLEIIHCEFGGGDGFVACTKLCLTVLFYTSVYIYSSSSLSCCWSEVSFYCHSLLQI